MAATATSRSRSLSALLAAALLTTIVGSTNAHTGAVAAFVDPAIRSVHRGTVHVIVQRSQPTDAAERGIVRLGGHVTRPLWIVDGFAADLPARSVPKLAHVPGVRAVTFDAPVHVMGSVYPATPTSAYPKVVRSSTLNDNGYTGAGVTVALIDTGIANVPDLAGRVLPVTDDITGAVTSCENLSGESNCNDSYGHGTFIAGLIAGNGASSGGKWVGAAPEANLVSVKIAGRDGSSDVSNVLAAIQWTVSFKDRYGIRVLNLSLGTNGTQSYHTDPMNYAVERAWAAGIVVVVSAGNLGPNAHTISKPGDDPFVITVGAIDDRGTPGLGDDELPNFSARGTTAADGISKPDIVAPGAHVVSLRAPGSAIDTQFPNYVDGSYRKGSGTSMATGVVSGSVADILDANPTWTPDRVKFALAATARPDASSDPQAVGAGVIDANAAATAAPDGLANQGLQRGTGLGPLQLSRGTVQVSANTLIPTVLQGATTAQLVLWDPVGYTTGDWNGYSWYGYSWYGYSWYGYSWYGYSWYATSWYGSTWSQGYSWYGASMNGVPDGYSWYGYSWYGSAWYGAWE